MHVCEQKRRRLEEKESGVQLGLQSYLRFYEIHQGSARLKTFEDFARSPYYRAFVKFGRHCQSIRAINIPRFIDWLLAKNKKIDRWCSDSVYGEYLLDYVKEEAARDAVARALERGLAWSETTGQPDRDYLRFGNDNAICYDITVGRITAWVLYNSTSGQEFLSRINSDHTAMIWPWIDADFWQTKFKTYPADVLDVQNLMTQAGW